MTKKYQPTKTYACPNSRYAPKPDPDETARLMRNWSRAGPVPETPTEDCHDESGLAWGRAGKRKQ